MKLGIVVRSDFTGLGYQSRSLVRLLQPKRLLLIDSSLFNPGAIQHPDWYEGYETITCGWPGSRHINTFLNGLTHVITCETPYSYYLYTAARQRGIKAFVQPNWEFLDWHENRELPKPHAFLVPSYWHLDDFKAMFPRAYYCPPPTFAEDFEKAASINLERRSSVRRFLHVVGKQAVADRNGTQLVLEALFHTPTQFELVIKSQYPVDTTIVDDRLTIEVGDVEDQADLYAGFDAMIMARRFGGLCLPMQEALMSALPVIMPDISPNNQVLPRPWVLHAETYESLRTRRNLDVPVYNVDVQSLAAQMMILTMMDDTELLQAKQQALSIGKSNYSADAVRPRWEEVLRG